MSFRYWRTVGVGLGEVCAFHFVSQKNQHIESSLRETWLPNNRVQIPNFKLGWVGAGFVATYESSFSPNQSNERAGVREFTLSCDRTALQAA